ncbi:MAG: NINE protein [Rhizonema sp. PD37]|nr:NINE protein [Rhizonema sp. PD37]
MKNKSMAIVLCFFLGGFGIHKFYLGENLAGVLYLLFSLTLIPSIISFFEFFILIFTSDADFNIKYNKGIVGGGYSGGAISAQDATKALGDLKKLYDAGVITAEEYEEKRQKLLQSI